jgi:hypothetical protein
VNRAKQKASLRGGSRATVSAFVAQRRRDPDARRARGGIPLRTRLEPSSGGMNSMPQLGKRYICDTCGTEILCNKPGNGTIQCCSGEMKLKEAKPLPSSD